MKRVLAIILGGGAGTRLYPLTKMRAKPAVPLAGKYRLIDIPISNCINSNINKMYVLTQFNSASLNRHLTQSYNLSAPFGQGFVEVLAAQQTPDSPSWFEGTADAVRKYQWLFQEWDVDEYLILSGDQLYRMDYSLFVEHHRSTGADLTVAALPVDKEQAESFGLMRTDKQGNIKEFSEIADNLYIALSLPYHPIGYVKNFIQLEKELCKYYKIKHKKITKSKIKIYYCINKLKIIKKVS